MDLMLIAKVLLPAVFIIAVFIEIYKKKIVKDKFHPKSIWKVAFSLSLALSTIGYFSFDLPGHYTAIIYYTVLVYALQYIVDMKLIKMIVKAYVKSKGIVLEGFEWDE